ITDLKAQEACSLKGLLFDLDDNLLDHGKLTEAAYSSLFRLRESGLLLVCVTGRPITWGKLLVRQWPIEAAVCETGALSAHWREGRLAIWDTISADARQANAARLAQLVTAMREQFSQLVVASDALERTSDFTFDIGETQKLSPEVAQQAAAFALSRGARTSKSSVHLHVSFDVHDKASGTLAVLCKQLGVDSTVARANFAYVGDSENDAPCFAAFNTSIGVANLQGQFTVPPRFVTRKPSAQGFVEAAEQIISQRSKR
ncbi:MAG TPA: HAD-IIB family hydrolase, partial [Polyangiaceae bacterium]|nr:HAD-IIB family hydrolase [Polyangiaceae bacterium]